MSDDRPRRGRWRRINQAVNDHPRAFVVTYAVVVAVLVVWGVLTRSSSALGGAVVGVGLVAVSFAQAAPPRMRERDVVVPRSMLRSPVIIPFGDIERVIVPGVWSTDSPELVHRGGGRTKLRDFDVTRATALAAAAGVPVERAPVETPAR